MLSGGGRRGMGGGGGGMLMKTFQRAVRSGVGGTSPNSNTNIGGVKAAEKAGFNNKRPTSPNTALTLSPYYSEPFSPFKTTDESESAPYSPLKNTPIDESGWECVDGIEDETAHFYHNYVFGTAPSRNEVQHAVFVLQQVAANEKVGKTSIGDSEEDVGNSVCGDDGKMVCLDGDWNEPSQSLYTSRMMQYSRSSDMAFHLLETDPSVQRMVLSLSSDQVVWDAVMNNEVVKELRESVHGVGGESLDEVSDDGGDENILEWIVMFAKAKIMQVWEKMRELMSPNQENEKRSIGDDGLNERVKTSFFLSMVVMIIVVISRVKNNTD